MKLAAKSGVNLSYLNRLERAEATPGLDLIGRLAEGLGVEMVDFFGRSGKSSVQHLRMHAQENIQNAISKSDEPALEMFASLGSLVAAGLSRR